ncbi:hypothetical protein ADK52_12555 [Streptomyces sp. WM6372]|uniref:hypothetical protein n=1 Tax=Streptomyces sp. WM6372 TaxID=1415555 RepID=UPI0006AFAA92|nr:hypothetical protein [Streptomyces sp. WM6372]KOU25424.1 hypothetical protein ADK52_12555 [Streptomyces sp. WM6372]
MTTRAHDAEVPPPAGSGAPAGPADPAAGGEPACLLHLVCPDCGRLATERGARSCSRCGAPLPAPGS